MRSIAAIFTLALTVPVSAADAPKYRVLAQDKGHVAIVGADGKVEWEVECKYNSHDIHLLPNGNLLLHTGAGDRHRDDAEEGSRLEVRGEAEGGIQGPRRGPRVPAARRRQHDGRRERQPADRRGGQGRQDRQGGPADG